MKLLNLFILALLAGVTAAFGAERKTVLFFGDSLTAGYGLEDPSTTAFPGLVQEKIDAAKLPYRVVNAGLSGETTSGGLRRIDWILRQPIDFFVLELGGNDGLRGLPVAVAEKNLQAIMDKVRAKNPSVKIVLVGMQMPVSMGDYARDFAAIFTRLAAKNDVTFLPFLLEGVGGRPELNLPDGIHPTEAGHKILAETMWKTLRPLLAAPPS